MQSYDGEQNNCSACEKIRVVYVCCHELMRRRCYFLRQIGSNRELRKVAGFVAARKMSDPPMSVPAAWPTCSFIHAKRAYAAVGADARFAFLSPGVVRWLRRALAEQRHGTPCAAMNAGRTLTSAPCTDNSA
jgi:hypothetical protein